MQELRHHLRIGELVAGVDKDRGQRTAQGLAPLTQHRPGEADLAEQARVPGARWRSGLNDVVLETSPGGTALVDKVVFSRLDVAR